MVLAPREIKWRDPVCLALRGRKWFKLLVIVELQRYNLFHVYLQSTLSRLNRFYLGCVNLFIYICPHSRKEGDIFRSCRSVSLRCICIGLLFTRPSSRFLSSAPCRTSVNTFNMWDFSTSAKPCCGGHAAVLGGQEGLSAHRGARRWLRTVQDGGQHRRVHPVLLRRARASRRKGTIYSTAGLFGIDLF